MDTELVNQEPGFPWHLGIYDAHCHPTDSMKHIEDIQTMKSRALTIMATRAQDQHLVAEVAAKFGSQSLETQGTSKQIVPAFGWHPWFSHQIYDDSEQESSKFDKHTHYEKVLTGKVENRDLIEGFPEPRPLSDLIARTRQYLEDYPQAMVGEIGIDRSFRIPVNFSPTDQLDEGSELTPGGREGRQLSIHRVQMDHQRAILKAQLNLAGQMSRAVSVHGVAAHGVLFDTLRDTWKGYEKPVMSKQLRKRRASVSQAHAHELDEDLEVPDEATSPKPHPPRICLHSYSGPPEQLNQYLSPEIPATIFFSFSQVINFSTSAAEKAEEVIKNLPQDRILVESDLHCAGERMDGLLEKMVREVCRIREWSLEDGVKILGENWNRFAYGET
ncbi:hypothetical protein MMC10_005090 [Thelotrema lepadinum]|nr:hypothetical protein [Thelotrema lepadinum]